MSDDVDRNVERTEIIDRSRTPASSLPAERGCNEQSDTSGVERAGIPVYLLTAKPQKRPNKAGKPLVKCLVPY